jgi:hypothetical protein
MYSLLLFYMTALSAPVAVSGWQVHVARGVLSTMRLQASLRPEMPALGDAAPELGCQQQSHIVSSSAAVHVSPAVSRRVVLFRVPALTAGLLASAPRQALATSTDAAKDQWKQSVRVIDAMLSDWSSLATKGGDAIRVELGTQGTTSPLFQIEKALRALRDEAEDLVEFTEQSDEFLLRLAAADSMAYSANFAGGSGKPTPPAVYIEKSKKEVEDMQRIAKALSALL